MSTPIRYNSATLVTPFRGMATASIVYDFDHLNHVGATGTASANFVLRTEGASNTGSGGQNGAEVTPSAGEYGAYYITSGSSSGARLCHENGNLIPITGTPIMCEFKAKFTSGSSCFFGFMKPIATATATCTTALAASTPGAGALITTAGAIGLISQGFGGSANTAVTGIQTLTAATYYRIGIKLFTNKQELYLNGKKIGEQAFGTDTLGSGDANAAGLSPTATLITVSKTKGLVADWIACGTE